jgi:hypothetical protein
MKLKSAFISLLILSSSVFAQNNPQYYCKHQFGINAGFTTGVGFSYRFWPGKLGIQATIMPIKISSEWTDIMNVQGLYPSDPGNPEGDFKMTSVGFTALVALHQGEKGRFFSYFGSHYIITNKKEQYNLGVGLGFAIESRVSFNFMIGYGAYDITRTTWFLPTTEIGIYYKFYE